MTVLRCKMCGGNVLPGESGTYGTCDSCGSTMTLPRINEDRVANLFNRANHYRQQKEFDKAQATYENILSEDGKNAEAYWGIVLSKFGIEYVEDPRSHKRIPTCHRVHSISILKDLDYQKAIEYALDEYSRSLYEQEAAVIAQIQRGILDIANKEEPFDVFICYKETDATGKRTIDSTIAQDVYYQLVREGLRVFFARITLEDKLGSAYEPYIFAALNSAKVMLVVGTKPEHFNAVWVKNEWSRYLDLIKNNPEKILIPAYRDMDPYDLPEEFSHLQSQDMSKIGFMQDLIRGIQKIASVDSESAPAAQQQAIAGGILQVEPLLERAFLCLEDKDWNKADDLLEQVLNFDPKNAQAYMGKLMVALKISHEKKIQENAEPISDFADYQKALRFASQNQKKIWQSYNQIILDRKEEERIEAERIAAEKHLKAVRLAEEKRLKSEKLRRSVIKFGALVAAVLIIFLVSKNVYTKAQELQEEKRAEMALQQANEADYNEGEKYLNEGDFFNASFYFNRAIGYKDALEKSLELQQKLSRIVQVQRTGDHVNVAKLNDDGTLFSAGTNIHGQNDVSQWRDIVDFIITTFDTIGLKKDGTVVGTGASFNGSNYIQFDVADWRDIVAISLGFDHIAGLREDGTVVATGDNGDGQCDVSNWSDITAVGTGYKITVGLKKDGTVVGTGYYFNDLTNYPEFDFTDWRDIVAIWVDDVRVAGLKKDGTVVGTGFYDEALQWRDIASLSIADGEVAGVKKDGTVVGKFHPIAEDPRDNIDVADWQNIAAVSIGHRYVLGLTRYGGVIFSGDLYNNGRHEVTEWRDIVYIWANDYCDIGLDKNGEIFIKGFKDIHTLKDFSNLYHK